MPQTAWALALLGLLAMAGLMRPLLPIDETRYAAVAWEMWARSDFLVPHLNGEPYAHKPPLLFWIVQAGWALFGVNEWWPRLVSPVFAGGTMALAARLARELWPARPDAARIAPLVLVSSLLFSYFASALMFDAMLGFFVTLGFLGLARAWREQAVASGFVLLGLGLGGALLSKGPVALVHLLPAALLAPLWMREARPRWGRWYAGVGLAVLGWRGTGARVGNPRGYCRWRGLPRRHLLGPDGRTHGRQLRSQGGVVVLSRLPALDVHAMDPVASLVAWPGAGAGHG